jgi:hypothetical protein
MAGISIVSSAAAKSLTTKNIRSTPVEQAEKNRGVIGARGNRLFGKAEKANGNEIRARMGRTAPGSQMSRVNA